MTIKWQRYGLTSVLLSSRWWVTYSPPCMMMWQNTITRRYSLASVFQEGICTFIPALLGEDWEQLASLNPPDYCNVWFRQDCLPFRPPRAVETRPTQVLQKQSGSVWVYSIHTKLPRLWSQQGKPELNLRQKRQGRPRVGWFALLFIQIHGPDSDHNCSSCVKCYSDRCRRGRWWNRVCEKGGKCIHTWLLENTKKAFWIKGKATSSMEIGSLVTFSSST